MKKYARLLDTSLPLLPAATKLGQGNIFTSVCQEFCPQSALWTLGRHAHPCWILGHLRRSRYALYCNAFLFSFQNVLCDPSVILYSIIALEKFAQTSKYSHRSFVARAVNVNFYCPV